MKRALLACSLLMVGLASLPACELYDGPPLPSIGGMKNGLLADPKAAIVINFSKAIDPATLKLEIAPYVIDTDGNLADEVDKNGDLHAIFTSDPQDGTFGGSADLSKDGTALTITPKAPLPAGAPLVVLVEPGLAAPGGGLPTHVRKRLVFGYELDIHCNAPSKVFPSGTYFLLAQVKHPIPTQVRLLAAIDVDPETGAFLGQFSKADRNPDPNRCPMPCAAPLVCELVPSTKCVMASEPAGSTDEFSDYVPNPGLPTGFSFAVKGCVVDQDDKTATFATGPVDVAVPSPPVTLRNVEVKAAFTRGDDGTLRATGTLAADDVLLGTTPSGPADGEVTSRSIPADQVPPGVPQPMQP